MKFHETSLGLLVVHMFGNWVDVSLKLG